MSCGARRSLSGRLAALPAEVRAIRRVLVSRFRGRGRVTGRVVLLFFEPLSVHRRALAVTRDRDLARFTTFGRQGYRPVGSHGVVRRSRS